MEFSEWKPAYEAIRRDMGYDCEGDAKARDVLADLVQPFETARLRVFDGATVAVCGAGPSLSAELDRARSADVVVAASAAADVLREVGLRIDAMVTDLDKNPGTARDLTHEAIPVAVHAHGDNVPQIRQYVPTFSDEHVLPTTQVEPRGPVENFGGFTDGDRGAFLADEFGAAELLFPGWDFDDPSVGTAKRAKLEWAERLLYWLELRRDDRFDVLDGRRDAIELPF